MGSVEELCHHIALINKSEKILDGQIDEIKEKYKSNKFSIDYQGQIENIESLLGSTSDVIKQSNNGKTNHLTVQLKNGNPNSILNQLTPHVQIFGFNEIVPNMNDVFIKVVEETNLKNKQN
jgi:ABC-2 type transport system ATP-binding protein